MQKEIWDGVVKAKVSSGQGSQKGSPLLEEAKEGSQKGAAADTWTTLSFIGACSPQSLCFVVDRPLLESSKIAVKFDVCFHAIPKSAQISPNQKSDNDPIQTKQDE
jgi:hypothetical protein